MKLILKKKRGNGLIFFHNFRIRLRGNMAKSGSKPYKNLDLDLQLCCSLYHNYRIYYIRKLIDVKACNGDNLYTLK